MIFSEIFMDFHVIFRTSGGFQTLRFLKSFWIFKDFGVL